VFVLLRSLKYESIDDCFDDEIPCKNVEELERMFESEKESFEWERSLPEDVLFDAEGIAGNSVKNDDDTIDFSEKWMPEIEEDGVDYAERS